MFEYELAELVKRFMTAIGNEVMNHFDSKLHTEVSNREVIDIYGDNGFKFLIKQDLDGTRLYTDVTIHFTHIGSCKANSGFFVEMIGECTDGTNTSANDIKECPADLLYKSDYKDFFDLIENYDSVEYCKKVIDLFLMGLREDLADKAA